MVYLRADVDGHLKWNRWAEHKLRLMSACFHSVTYMLTECPDCLLG